MNIDDTLSLWRSSYYEHINAYLINKKETDVRIENIIKILCDNMVYYKYIKHSFPTIFYRGDNLDTVKYKSYNKKTFISITFDKETAESFTDSVLYKITIDDNVKCIKTGIEYELLLEPNCCWHYISHNNILINVHITPFNNNYLITSKLLSDNN